MTTPAPTLNANTGTSAAIFADLGTGTTFGTFALAPGAPSDVLNFPLNAAGIAAFNAGRGGFFSIGSSIGASEASPENTFIYGGSGGFDTQQLVVNCLPESKEQCKNGGWRDFGDTFKNQGQCVAFVQRGPKP